MSDKINLAGKNIVVDSIKEIRKTSSSLQSIRSAYEVARAKGKAYDILNIVDETIAGVQDDLDDLADAVSGQDEEVTKTLCRIGARLVVRNSSYQIDVYAYNPRKPYHYFDITDPDAYQDDYYTSAGFVTCDGANLPVSILNNYTSFTPANHGGVWAIAIYKANVLDEAYTPIILCPCANGQVMEWRKTDNTVMSSMLDVWIIGGFKVSYSNNAVTGLSELYVAQEGIAPSTFLKNHMMWLMNEADGTPTQDFTDWAIAMGVDQIFKRLAVLEAFVSRLDVNFLSVGSGTDAPSGGFFMHIHDAKNNNPPEILAKYNGNRLWQIDPVTGKMYGNFAEVRQYLPFQFDDSLDDTYPMECDFYIPTNAVIVSIKLSSKGKNYRSYSKAAASGGSSITSAAESWYDDIHRTAPNISLTVTKLGQYDRVTGSGGAHKHSYDKTTGVGGFSGDGAHQHGLYYGYGTNYTGYSGTDNHRHTYDKPVSTGNNFGNSDGAHNHTNISTTPTDTSETGSHTHSIPELVSDVSITVNKLRTSDLQHTHVVDISHSHDLTFGIYEGTTPTGVELFCSNDGSTYGSAISGASATADNSNFDITSNFSGTGWKKIKFTSTRLGRIQAQLIIELLVTT